tara:strand:- start:349 stop:744 length:396 start_codon:yes stop_codon:yes gene_type:complete
MGQIRIFNGPPKAFEFNQEDLVIDNINGDIYYKDWKGNLQKIIRSNDVNASINLKNLKSSTIITTNITASGNISASGIVIANNFQSDGQKSIGISDSMSITGSITSSGNISSSGEIIANTGSFNIIEGGVF